MDGQPQRRSPKQRIREREQALATLAAGQHGVVERRQLLELGVTPDAIDERLRTRRLVGLHRGVYAISHGRLTRYGRWMAAVLAYGPGAALSHQSAAALWGLMGHRGAADVSAPRGRHGRQGIRLHRVRLAASEVTRRSEIPVTTVPRTLLDLAGYIEEAQLERAFEEADRLRLLSLDELARTCDRAGRRAGVRRCRRLVSEARAPITTRSPLEERFASFCRDHQFPEPLRNVLLLDREVDVLWAPQRVVVELDGYAYHAHHRAFERDRARDAAMLAAGYRVVRVTHRRLTREARLVAAELRTLLESDRR